MAVKNELGTPRRSQVINNFGPGAIVDFSAGPGGTAAISVVVGGLDEWDRMSKTPGLLHKQTVFEPRLQKRLNVKGFRLPPVNLDSDEYKDYLVGVRFPSWLQCPSCGLIRRASKWGRRNPGNPVMHCQSCTAKEKGGRQVIVGPVRFVIACPKGHLDEFPWERWAHHKQKKCENPELRLRQSGKAGLAGLVLSCKCGAFKSMEGVFGQNALREVTKCFGNRPWLGDQESGCDKSPRTLQRGASNVYFSVQASALDIPPWSNQIHQQLGVYWDDIVNTPVDERPMFIKYTKLEEKTGLTKDEILERVAKGESSLKGSEGKSIRFEEYEQFVGGGEDSVGASAEFEIHDYEPPIELGDLFSRIVQANRLREVRAIRSFTRILPPTSEATEDSPEFAAISIERKDWLPAIEVRGEGIFFQFNENKLKNWEQNEEVKRRAQLLDEAWKRDWLSRHDTDKVPPRTITPRFVLVHSFAHALIRQLSLECGYSSASLRERLYVDSGDMEMAGLLIYTATPDSDGTLGGLVRQGLPNRMVDLIPSAIRALQWCSNDPICINDINTFTDEQNLAACHSCMLASETSCEEFNRLLDRALLIGKPDDPSVGYFSSMLGEEEL